MARGEAMGGVWNRVEPKRYIRHELSFYSVVGSKLVVGEGTTKLVCPQADRLVRDNDPRTGQHVLDHPQAQKQNGKKAHTACAIISAGKRRGR